MTAPLSPEILTQRRLEKALIKVAELQSMNKKLLRKGGMAMDQVIDELRGALQAEKQAPFKHTPKDIAAQKRKAKAPVSEGHRETAVLVLSDWHLSERVKAKDSNGVNEYSSPIAANRVWEIVDTFKRIIRMHQAMYPIERIWLPVLGDMINGSIHPEFLLTNDLSDVSATILCSRLLIMAIQELLTLGIPIRVDCIVGNHPRLLAKMPTKVQAHMSFDWAVYEIVANYFAGHKMVDFNIHTGQIGLVKMYHWNYVIEHGIDVKNGREEEFEDRIRALFDDPTFREATGLTGSSYDQIIIGNLHKPAFLERTIKNGALVGQNELGQAWRLKPIKAVQQMFGISKSHVRTFQYSLDVTDTKTAKRGDNAIVDYTLGFMQDNARF